MYNSALGTTKANNWVSWVYRFTTEDVATGYCAKPSDFKTHGDCKIFSRLHCESSVKWVVDPLVYS